MSVNVPVYHYQTRTDDTGDIFPYGFAEANIVSRSDGLPLE